jgi:hypothetical protein
VDIDIGIVVVNFGRKTWLGMGEGGDAWTMPSGHLPLFGSKSWNVLVGKTLLPYRSFCSFFLNHTKIHKILTDSSVSGVV